MPPLPKDRKNMENSGWIKIHRKILDWEWYQDFKTLKLFFHLILIANRNEKKWRGITIEEGETIRSLETLSKETKLTVRSIRTAINNLKSTGEVTERKHHFYRILKVKNYKRYQETTEPLTRQRQDNDKRTTHNKNQENHKKKERSKKIFSTPPVASGGEGEEEKMDCKDFVSWFRELAKEKGSRAIGIIAEFADELDQKGLAPDLRTKKQWQAWSNGKTKRWAKELEDFGDDQLAEGMKRMLEKNYLTDFNLGTLKKFVTNSKK